MHLSLGIDTSCYTTSAAVVDEGGNLIADERKVLTVCSGERGLRQSEALFQHVKNIPELIRLLKNEIDWTNVKRISVSSRPRPDQDSYMPVFLCGVSYAEVIADTIRTPVSYYSHQEGHMMAGIWSSGAKHLLNKNFLSFHISGGTTEILQVKNKDGSFDIQIIGGSRDLHAGQFIDRIGVSLGLLFPAGAELEKLALQAGKSVKIPVSAQGLWTHFSGPETHAQRLIEKGQDAGQIALGVIECISASIYSIIKNAVKETGINEVLMVGGVCANSIMKNYLLDKLDGIAQVYFAQPRYSTDNAVGTALLGQHDSLQSGE